MRIFIFILSLIIAVACVFLNILGFNGTLTQTEFLLINVVVEFLLCMILGHFMYRTYANYKRAKNLSQELTNTQAALQLKTKEAAEAQEAMQKASATAQAPQSESASENMSAESAAASATEPVEVSSPTTEQPAVHLENTQPLANVHEATNDLEAPTLFKAPLTK